MRIALVQQPAGPDTAGNRVGESDFAGESFVCGPDGVVLAQAGTGTTETLTADLDLSACDRSFARRLFLPKRRPDLYPGWLGPSGSERVGRRDDRHTGGDGV